MAHPIIPITKTTHPRLPHFKMETLQFGKHFTDHMLTADYVDGEWKNIEIKPYAPFEVDPASAVLHYGQTIFEGIKAYKNSIDEVVIFRPDQNFIRFNVSADRMQMPAVPEWLFMEGMKQLIALDKDWIPSLPEHSLYIRPFIIATDPFLGVRPSTTYKFMIILGPSGPYFSAPMKIVIEEKYTRAAPGGVGYAKNGGNYGGSLYPVELAKKRGFDQILWTDASEHKYVEEVGVMNVMFVIDGKVITPSLERGTVLKGVTRDSAIILLRDMGYAVEERNLSVDEIVEAHKKGLLQEAFGVGTAAVVSFIINLTYKDYSMDFDLDTLKVAPALKQHLNDIRVGNVPDKHNWLEKLPS
ncbi:MAG: branched-chain amino acid aminotransferase [Chitinophagaceae bacterium]|jgi:branched-chain amino acid aminotransferase|nr:MAG: branched-chain amino acid aminotransferase [Chitinophagaceae bacterium]